MSPWEWCECVRVVQPVLPKLASAIPALSGQSTLTDSHHSHGEGSKVGQRMQWGPRSARPLGQPRSACPSPTVKGRAPHAHGCLLSIFLGLFAPSFPYGEEV